MRDSFIFYRSFYESLKTLKSREKQKLFEAICEYALNGEEIELVGAADGMFKLLKPQLDANTRKYENGCKGGRPKQNQTETKTKPKRNQSVSKPKRNDNDNVNVNDNDNDNDNVNVNVNDNHNALGSSVVSGSDVYGVDDEFNIYKKMTPQDVDTIYESYPNSGGDLIQAVYEDVKKKRKKVGNAVPYILGYANKVLWDDNAEHGGDRL